MNKKFALISTYEKKGISQICRAFKKNNIGIISTGKTAQHIIKLGYKCKTIDSASVDASRARILLLIILLL